MIDTPEILDVPAQTSAAIRLDIPATTVRGEMGAGREELTRALADQGVEKTGPWFTHHFKIPDANFYFEICFPVAAGIKPYGRVAPAELAPARVARTIYRGPYDGLGAGWGQFMAWINAQGLSMRGDFWEVYVTGPDDTADPAQYATQLNVPLKE